MTSETDDQVILFEKESQWVRRDDVHTGINMAAAQQHLGNLAKIHDPFGPGAIVHLKTNGPYMVVLKRITDEVLVAWHNDSGDLFEKMLPVVALKPR